MSRTHAHRPTKTRPDGENIDNVATVPRHGRSGYLRAIDRTGCDRLLSKSARERSGLLQNLANIRSLDDAQDAFGDDIRREWATYDPAQDDAAQAALDAEEATLRAELQDYDYNAPYWDDEPNYCPCCGKAR